MSSIFPSIDIEYICTTIGNLSGIPIRIFKNEEQVFYHSFLTLPKDPINLYKEQIMKISDSIGYFATETFQYYGIINSGNTKIVIGPSGLIQNSEKQLRELAFNCDVEPEDTEAFINGMRSITPISLESILQMLCTVNYILNGEKKSLADISIVESEQNDLTNQFMTKQTSQRLADEFQFNYKPQSQIHNTYDIENTMSNMIQKGDTEALKKWVSQIPTIHGGTLAPDQLRQRKNMFIVTATTASRAAIKGGLDFEDAFQLSDSYIQKCEMLNSPDRITNLQFHMILDFIERVEHLRNGKNTTKLALKVANYIQHHITQPISTEEMAHELGMSRPYLSKKFTKETGRTLTEYILIEKTEEAKHLLQYSDKSLTAISLYLGFSSQSHFSNVFKKYAGKTPAEYRNDINI